MLTHEKIPTLVRQTTYTARSKSTFRVGSLGTPQAALRQRHASSDALSTRCEGCAISGGPMPAAPLPFTVGRRDNLRHSNEVRDEFGGRDLSASLSSASLSHADRTRADVDILGNNFDCAGEPARALSVAFIWASPNFSSSTEPASSSRRALADIPRPPAETCLVPTDAPSWSMMVDGWTMEPCICSTFSSVDNCGPTKK
eukprot:4858757-Prymnesium_polylepis.2